MLIVTCGVAVVILYLKIFNFGPGRSEASTSNRGWHSNLNQPRLPGYTHDVGRGCSSADNETIAYYLIP